MPSSILAEPRKKQRISVDPQNLQWRNDECAFGKRLMTERMGWKGGGMGKEEHGMCENVRLKANYTQRGLGSGKEVKESGASNGPWMAHHDEYAQLLAQLNEKKKTPVVGESSSSCAKEEGKSEAKELLKPHKKSARYRPHRRHVRCKDLSLLSTEQKRAIFGTTMATDEEDPKMEAEEGITKEEKEPEKEEAETDNLRTSSVTMSEYFAQKMAVLAKKKNTKTKNRDAVEENEDIVG